MENPMCMQLMTRTVTGMGNVPRLLVVYSSDGNVDDVVEIDYGNIPEQYRGLTRLPDVELTKRDFRGWTQLLKARKERSMR